MDTSKPVDISGEAQLLQAVPVEEGEAAGCCLEGLPGQALPSRLVPVQLGQGRGRLLELNKREQEKSSARMRQRKFFRMPID